MRVQIPFVPPNNRKVVKLVDTFGRRPRVDKVKGAEGTFASAHSVGKIISGKLLRLQVRLLSFLPYNKGETKMDNFTFTRLFNEKVKGIDPTKIARELKISTTTFDRWLSGKSAPHNIGRQSVFDALDRM